MRIPLAIRVMAVGLGAMILAALLVPVLVERDPAYQDLRQRLRAPVFLGGTAEHFLGTDQLGRDVLIRAVYATRTTLLISFSGMLVAWVVGTLLGVVAGLYGGWPDRVATFVMDANLSIPFMLIVFQISLIGDWLRDVLDPKIKDTGRRGAA